MLYFSPLKPRRWKTYPCVCLMKRTELFGWDASLDSTQSKQGTNCYAKRKPMKRHPVWMMHHPKFFGEYLEAASIKQGKNIFVACMYRSLANKAESVETESAGQSQLQPLLISNWEHPPCSMGLWTSPSSLGYILWNLTRFSSTGFILWLSEYH